MDLPRGMESGSWNLLAAWAVGPHLEVFRIFLYILLVGCCKKYGGFCRGTGPISLAVFFQAHSLSLSLPFFSFFSFFLDWITLMDTIILQYLVIGLHGEGL